MQWWNESGQWSLVARPLHWGIALLLLLAFGLDLGRKGVSVRAGVLFRFEQ